MSERVCAEPFPAGAAKGRTTTQRLQAEPIDAMIMSLGRSELCQVRAEYVRYSRADVSAWSPAHWRTHLWAHKATVFIGGEEVVADDPSDPIRTMVRQILGAVNEYARRDAMLKMHSGRKAIRRADSGRYIGGVPPAGCIVVEGRLVATPELVEQVAAIRDGLASGLSANTMAKNLGLHPQQISRPLATAERVGV